MSHGLILLLGFTYIAAVVALIASRRIRTWALSTPVASALNLFTLLAVAATFLGFYFTIRQYDLQLTSERQAQEARRKADKVLLQHEIERNYQTAAYVIKACLAREKGEAQVPLTCYTDIALQRAILTDDVVDGMAYFNMIALKKLYTSSNRLLDSVVEVHGMHLTAIVQQQPKIDILLNEYMEMLRKDAENIQLKSRELDPWFQGNLE